jgi:hypothetical protein
MIKVGDEVWHIHFAQSGQVNFPGVVTEIDSPRSIIVLWPDGIVESYDEHELSPAPPEQCNCPRTVHNHQMEGT